MGHLSTGSWWVKTRSFLWSTTPWSLWPNHGTKVSRTQILYLHLNIRPPPLHTCSFILDTVSLTRPHLIPSLSLQSLSSLTWALLMSPVYPKSSRKNMCWLDASARESESSSHREEHEVEHHVGMGKHPHAGTLRSISVWTVTPSVLSDVDCAQDCLLKMSCWFCLVFIGHGAEQRFPHKFCSNIFLIIVVITT